MGDRATSLGFKLKPGDLVRVLGDRRGWTVIACILELVGTGQEEVRKCAISLQSAPDTRMSIEESLLLAAEPISNSP